MIREGEVEAAIAVHVPQGHLAGADGQLDRRPGGRAEAAPAVAEHDDDVPFRAGDDEVRLAVAVDIADDYVLRAAGDFEGGAGGGGERLAVGAREAPRDRPRAEEEW